MIPTFSWQEEDYKIGLAEVDWQESAHVSSKSSKLPNLKLKTQRTERKYQLSLTTTSISLPSRASTSF